MYGVYGAEWIVAVICDEDNNRFTLETLDRIPWEHWAGMVGRIPHRDPLLDGDFPKAANEEFKRARTNTHEDQ